MHSDTISRDHASDLIIHRAAIEAAMTHYLAAAGQPAEANKPVVRQLFDVLLGGLEGGGPAPRLDEPGIRRLASRFGDGLSPILRDALGADVPEAFVARCVDSYWRTLQAAAI